MHDTWLEDYKEYFVSAWTNQQHNFGQHTTNRVESQHANLKRYINTPNCSLDKLVGYVDEVIRAQTIALHESFETSLIKTMSDHRLPLFDYIRGKVSHQCLDLLVVQLAKLHNMRKWDLTCGCQIFTSCGIPCACRLEKYENTGRKYYYSISFRFKHVC